jgi:hypothetical protein
MVLRVCRLLMLPLVLVAVGCASPAPDDDPGDSAEAAPTALSFPVSPTSTAIASPTSA